MTTKGDERYEVKNNDAQRQLRTIAELVREHLPEGWGFGLLMFEYGPDGSLFYISSAAREDMIVVMREWVAKQEGITWRMDTRNLTMYATKDAAIEAGVPESAISEMQTIADSTWRATSGPFKGRIYRRNHLGQMERDREAERAEKGR